jgi:hypothetical protein
MKSTPSPRVRFLAVLALILLAGGGAYVLLHGSSPESNTAATQTTLPTTTSTKTATTKQKTEQPKKKQPKKKKKSAHKTAVEGVNALDAALAANRLVVVSVYAHNVTIDIQAMKEARAGAARAGVGFVAFDVFNEKIARQLATLLGDNQAASPEVLFFKQGRTLVFALQGFADSQVVAQAAKNVSPHIEPWVYDATTICKRFSASFAAAQRKVTSADRSTAAGRKQAAAALEEAAGLIRKETKSLSKVRTTSSDAKSYAQLLTDLEQIATNMGSEAVALRSNDLTTAKTFDQKNAVLVESASTLATNLQIPACAS